MSRLGVLFVKTYNPHFIKSDLNVFIESNIKLVKYLVLADGSRAALLECDKEEIECETVKRIIINLVGLENIRILGASDDDSLESMLIKNGIDITGSKTLATVLANIDDNDETKIKININELNIK